MWDIQVISTLCSAHWKVKKDDMMAELRSHLLFRTLVSSSNSLGLFIVSKYTCLIIGPRHFLAFTCNQAIFRIWYSNWKIHDKDLTRVSFRSWYSNWNPWQRFDKSQLQKLIFQLKSMTKIWQESASEVDIPTEIHDKDLTSHLQNLTFQLKNPWQKLDKSSSEFDIPT